MPYVFLNPDGTRPMGLLVIVEAQTGVTYGHQCAGHATEDRSVEGFLIPVGDAVEARSLVEWFERHFKGSGCSPLIQWDETLVQELAALVSQIPCWRTEPDGAVEGEKRLFLSLDVARLDECVEAWVPVVTPYGAGILVFDNSD